MCEMLRDHSPSLEDDFFALNSYKENPAGWRTGLAEYLGLGDEAHAKRLLIATLCWGLPKTDVPMLWALASDTRRAAGVVLASPRFAYLTSLFSERRNPTATRMSYALGAVEDDIVTAVQTRMAAHLPEITAEALMFDGAILSMPAESEAQLEHLLASVGETKGVSFTIKHFPILVEDEP